jgi:hypothetical protein
MTYKCEFHSEVEKDYNEAYEWYESQKKGLGERFLTFVRQKIDQIAEHPEHCKQHGTILVISIHHTKKHPRKKFRK